jgi:hypothetical protein
VLQTVALSPLRTASTTSASKKLLQSVANCCFLLPDMPKEPPGKPFQSKLEPHRDFIVSSRRARMTWRQIAEAITAKGTPCTRQAVQGFYKRRRKRPHAMGMEPDPSGMESLPAPRRSNPTAPLAPPPTGVDIHRSDLTEDEYQPPKLKVCRHPTRPNP